MTGQFRITPETMRTRAKSYRTESSAMETIIRNMDGLLLQLQEEWEGQAAGAYAEKFAELRPSFLKARDLIDEIAANLSNTADIVEETDRQLAGQYVR